MRAKNLLALFVGSIMLSTGLLFSVQAQEDNKVYLPLILGGQGVVVSTPTPTPTDLPAATPTATVTPTATPTSLDIAEEVLIPAGTFQMGCDVSNLAESCFSNEQPLHMVYLDGYHIDKYPVTNARYKACVDAGGCTAPQSVNSSTRSPYYGNATYANFPVINVTWHQASAFCAWADKRLPTEAEWEKAARGSSDTRKYPWGNEDPTCSLANYVGSTGYCVGDTSEVGSYPAGASPYGVMDMAGNVWEWVNDWYQADYYSVSPDSNPQGPATGPERVLRGTWWNGYGESLRSAYRNYFHPDFWDLDYGFRCVRSP
jgi:eukaryotic-like serine/threonine-protein kinase